MARKNVKGNWECNQFEFLTSYIFQHAIKKKIIAEFFLNLWWIKRTGRKYLRAYRAMNWWNISWYGTEISSSQSKRRQKHNSERIMVPACRYQNSSKLYRTPCNLRTMQNFHDNHKKSYIRAKSKWKMRHIQGWIQGVDEKRRVGKGMGWHLNIFYWRLLWNKGG